MERGKRETIRMENAARQQGADGILGNRALMRFHVIFDYSRSLLHIQPNRFFKKTFYKD